MGFNTKGLDTTEKKGASQYFGYGEQELKINKFEVKTAKTGAKNVTLYMETRPINAALLPDFEPHADATSGGQIGKCSMYQYWLKDVNDENSESHQKFMRDIGTIADKMGVRSQIDAITANDFDAYVETLNSILTGKYKFWKIVVEEYFREGKAPGTKYSLGRYSKENICCADEKGKVKFDKENSYDYKKMETPDSTPLDTKKVTDDLPF